MIALWVILAIVVGAVASSSGRSFIGYTALSIFLSPLVGFIVLLIASINNPGGKRSAAPVQTSGAMTKACPKCGERVSKSLYMCPKCGTVVPE